MAEEGRAEDTAEVCSKAYNKACSSHLRDDRFQIHR